jgi:hypothetical protein
MDRDKVPLFPASLPSLKAIFKVGAGWDVSHTHLNQHPCNANELIVLDTIDVSDTTATAMCVLYFYMMVRVPYFSKFLYGK